MRKTDILDAAESHSPAPSVDADPEIPDTAFRDAIPRLPRGEELFTRGFAALAWLYGLYWIIWRWTSSLNADALIFSIVQPSVGVWPAPHENERAWRLRLLMHEVYGVLVALTGVGALAVALLDPGSPDLPAGFRWLAGPAILGFGAAFGPWGYVRLGSRASHGAIAPIITSVRI